ncbi:MAG TPA: hypothetical protein VF226_09610 [Hyphomicrobiaceae bacterium]
MSGKASIIIGFTPFHLLPMIEVLQAMEGDAYFFHPSADDPCIGTTEQCLAFLGKCNDPHLHRIEKYFRAGRDLDRIAKRYGEVDVYVPHPFNPLSNRAFFHPSASGRFIYQDGLLNYYDALSPLSSRGRRLRQMAKAAAVGLLYRTYEGHLSGVDSRTVSGGFFTHPDRIVRAGSFPVLRRLDFGRGDKGGRPIPDGGTLFLDQPIEEVVDAGVARELRRQTLDYVNRLGGRVYYKPHYSQKDARCFDAAWRPVGRELGALPAEWVAPKLDVANVVSFFTSALANVAMSNDAVTCHATAAHAVPISIDGRRTSLAELLSGFGVKTVDLLPPRHR